MALGAVSREHLQQPGVVADSACDPIATGSVDVNGVSTPSPRSKGSRGRLRTQIGAGDPALLSVTNRVVAPPEALMEAVWIGIPEVAAHRRSPQWSLRALTPCTATATATAAAGAAVVLLVYHQVRTAVLAAGRVGMDLFLAVGAHPVMSRGARAKPRAAVLAETGLSHDRLATERALFGLFVCHWWLASRSRDVCANVVAKGDGAPALQRTPDQRRTQAVTQARLDRDNSAAHSLSCCVQLLRYLLPKGCRGVPACRRV